MNSVVKGWQDSCTPIAWHYMAFWIVNAGDMRAHWKNALRLRGPTDRNDSDVGMPGSSYSHQKSKSVGSPDFETTADKVMGVLDELNGRWRRGTLRAASVATAPAWAMRRDLMSSIFTTKIDQLWTVKAR